MTHNQVAYFEARNNEAKNLETARHNKRQEDLSQKQIDVTKEYNYLQAVNTAQQLAETARHNRAAESLQYAQIDVQRAYNEAQMQLANANLLIATRGQDTKEGNLAETIRSNKAREEEQERHNVAVEVQTQKQNFWSNLISIGNTVAHTASAVATGLLTRSVQKKSLAE